MSPGTLRLTRGDFRQRTRSYGYLVTLAITLYAAYIFVPPNESTYSTVSIGGHRGVYNSAWIGTVVALLTNAFLSLAGFYLVKNSIRRDITTRVGQIIAASRVSTFRYLCSKWLSNLALLSSMVLVLAPVAVVMQLVRGEDSTILLWPLIAPFLFGTMPMMAAVSAVAVAFESVAFLRGGAGNIVFFFLWTVALGSAASSAIDVLGFQDAQQSMQAAAARAFPDYDPVKGGMSVGINFNDSGEAYRLTTFVWPGIHWTSAMALRRSGWIAASILVVAASTLAFGRFDEVSRSARRRRRKKNLPVSADAVPAVEPGPVWPAAAGASLSPLQGTSPRMNVLKILRGELTLALKGVNRWWIGVAGVLFVLALALPLGAVREFIMPLTAVWPILLWSSLGSREITHRTEQLMFSCPRPLRNQFIALWCAGVILAFLTGGGIGARFIVSGEWESLFGWFTGMLFIPSLAVACGVWSGSSRLFEIVYLILWYIGPMNKLPWLDYLSSSAQALASGGPMRFLAVTTLLVALGLLGRKRQLARL